jgi:penicillin-binding protein-related factor A (putative recombinase)
MPNDHMPNGHMPPVRADLQGAGVDTGGVGRQGRRALAGGWLETELEQVHTVYARRGLGRLVKNNVPTKVVARVTQSGDGKRYEKLRAATGPAVVDYTGWVWPGGLYVPTPLTDPAPLGTPPDLLRLALVGLEGRGMLRTLFPVAYDAKGVQGQSSYLHDRDALHQLDFLQNAHIDGAWAFLLLLDDRAGLGWVLRADVATCQRLRTGWRAPVCERQGGDVVAHHLPHFVRRPPLEREHAPGWDWLPAVAAVFLTGGPSAGSPQRTPTL